MPRLVHKKPKSISNPNSGDDGSTSSDAHADPTTSSNSELDATSKESRKHGTRTTSIAAVKTEAKKKPKTQTHQDNPPVKSSSSPATCFESGIAEKEPLKFRSFSTPQCSVYPPYPHNYPPPHLFPTYGPPFPYPHHYPSHRGRPHATAPTLPHHSSEGPLPHSVSAFPIPPTRPLVPTMTRPFNPKHPKFGVLQRQHPLIVAGFPPHIPPHVSSVKGVTNAPFPPHPALNSSIHPQLWHPSSFPHESDNFPKDPGRDAPSNTNLTSATSFADTGNSISNKETESNGNFDLTIDDYMLTPSPQPVTNVSTFFPPQNVPSTNTASPVTSNKNLAVYDKHAVVMISSSDDEEECSVSHSSSLCRSKSRPVPQPDTTTTITKSKKCDACVNTDLTQGPSYIYHPMLCRYPS